MPRKCSNCGNIGHNSRTCSSTSPTTSQLKLKGRSSDIGPSTVGVDEDDHFSSSSSSLPFSVSEFVEEMMILTSLPSSVAYSWTEATRLVKSCSMACEIEKIIRENNQGIGHQEYSKTTNKGGPWSEEEHQRFLEGVEELGKGNWKGISENFVTTRTRSQIASHAQNYYQNREKTTIATSSSKPPTSITADDVDPS